MHDEILEAEAREQLIAQGLEESSIDFALEDMRDQGMFDNGWEQDDD